jgi:hypothetical protein
MMNKNNIQIPALLADWVGRPNHYFVKGSPVADTRWRLLKHTTPE